MRFIPHRQIAAFLLAAAIFISFFPAGTLAAEDATAPGMPSTPTSPAEETVPETSEPASSEPEVSSPEITEPVPSEPEISDPQPSEPETSEPLPSEPEASEPAASEPIPSEPAASEPQPSEPESTEPTSPEPADPILMTMSRPPETVVPLGPGLYFGILHAHSGISDESGSPEAIFQAAAETEGLDFFAVTDHSDSFDNHECGTIGMDGRAISEDWAAGKTAAAAVTSHSFVGMFGYEMSWPSQMKIGHISSFGTPGFQSWQQEPYSTYNGALDAYYETLSSVSGAVSQFNHPGTRYGTFHGFEYSPSADRSISLIELDFDAADLCRYYTAALDKGWHLAPTGSRDLGDSVRTAVHAQSLTEAGILDALGSCRTYATEDTDLEILYSMDGYQMGAQTELRHLGDSMDISVSLHDPTDSAIGLVEVITNGGASIAQQSLSDASGTLTFSLPPAAGYYYLNVTQPDGDRAVTAPIWVDGEEDLGIADLTCETPVPVQNEELVLTLALYNQEASPLLVESLTVLADGIPVFTDIDLSEIPGSSELSHRLNVVCDCVGATEITVKLTGTLDGSPRSYEASTTLSFHQSSQVTSILADSGHGNAGLQNLTLLKTLALKDNIRLTADTVTADNLKNCRFLLVCAPSQPFSDEFLTAVTEFAGYGGSLVLCGQADILDTGIHSAKELNRLLNAVGSGMRFEDDLVQDPVSHGANISILNSDEINKALPWCEGISDDQIFRFAEGCSVIPGSGTWMVKGHRTTLSTDADGDGLGGTAAGETVLMACEELPGGGTIVAAGSLFLDDAGLKEPQNIRDPGYANRTIVKNLLGIGGDPIPLSTIQTVRGSQDNGLFRIRGYVTAGTSNPYNTFPDTLYLQDDTGGIAVTPFTETGIQTGTALEITGYTQTRNGNRILKLSDWNTPEIPMYFTQPKSGSWNTLLDPAENGGTLVEVTGTCLEIYCREDDTLAGCLLEDDNGNLAKIQIDEGIFAGSDGKNDLHETIRKGRTVWAMGLLHINEYGNTVIRVRNCEEVVYVPPRTYLNPRTGDRVLPLAVSAMICAASGLLLLKKKGKA